MSAPSAPRHPYRSPRPLTRIIPSTLDAGTHDAGARRIPTSCLDHHARLGHERVDPGLRPLVWWVPSYVVLYDPAAGPDRERGELLRRLMPRAGKRRETAKYKQYYWVPAVGFFTTANDTIPQILPSSKVISPIISILLRLHATLKSLSTPLWF